MPQSVQQSAPRADADAILSALSDERLRHLAGYWLGKRNGHRVTRRQDIDPVEIGTVLPYIWLYDYEPAGRRFRCRLAGEDIRSTYEMNIVGKYLDEFLLADNWPKIQAHYLAVVDGPAIGHARGQVYRTSLNRIGYGERVVFPLSDGAGETVIMLLGATVYHSLPTRDLTQPIERQLFPLAE